MVKATSRKNLQKGGTTDRPERGCFITFEGGEGAGKSSQIARLEKYLQQQGNPVLLTREPGGSPGAEAVRHVLLSGAAEPLGAEMECILFFAARSDNVETIIKPALAENRIVLCDRYYDSTRVYQGKVGKVEPQFIERLIDAVCEDAIPNLTFILDIDPHVGMERARKRGGDNADRFEKDELKLQQLRREGFLEIAAREPERCVVINGNQSEEAVFDQIVDALGDRLPRLKANPDGAGTSPPKRKPHTKKKVEENIQGQGRNRTGS